MRGISWVEIWLRFSLFTYSHVYLWLFHLLYHPWNGPTEHQLLCRNLPRKTLMMSCRWVGFFSISNPYIISFLGSLTRYDHSLDESSEFSIQSVLQVTIFLSIELFVASTEACEAPNFTFSAIRLSLFSSVFSLTLGQVKVSMAKLMHVTHP